ncbi:MAG: hypothetical protein F7C33_06690 [Desulfurococcales archaeon]|nr:hypothetical protein [Desulfurococcales archaeon]
MSLDTAESATPAVPFMSEDTEGFGATEHLEMLVSLLAIGSVGDEEVRSGVVEEVANIFDELLSLTASYIDPSAAGLIGYPLVDIFELTECIGTEALYEVIVGSVNTLAGNADLDYDTVDILADCLGWEEQPDKNYPIRTASGVIMSLAGAINKAIINYL